MKRQKSTGFAQINWPPLRAALAVTITTLLLAGCGGGGDATSSAAPDTTAGTGSTQPETPVVPANVSLPQALFELNYPQVVNTDYLSVTSGSATRASAASAASAPPAPAITPTELLNWAEAIFLTRFPAGAQNQTSGNLTYRYYPATQRYLGVANNVIYAFGSDTANRVVNAGNLGDFNCTVKPGSCNVIPVQAFTCDTNAITCVEVVSTAGAPQSSVPVTFGQPFKAGDWKHSTQGLMAKVDGATIPLQADEISSHRDGSARFAVLSAQLNNLAAGQTKVINLYTGAKTSSAPNVTSSPDWNLEIEAQLFDAAGNATQALIAQPQSQLVSQIATGTERRLAGAVASEYTVALPFKYKTTGQQHPHLTARLHTRLVDGGARIRTDMVIENTRTWTPDPGNITYSLTVKRNGNTLFTQPKFTHYHHARWHKVLWTGTSTEPKVRVRHHMPYFVATRAVWNYNLSITVPETVLVKEESLLAKKRQEQSALGPMGNAFLEPYFPTTGGRIDIGPLPRWTALYLVSQDDRMLNVMLANADAAAAVPIHYRDEDSDQPLDLDRYPKVTVKIGISQPALPALAPSPTIWTPDIAHQASFTYVPYMVTGDAFYLDELMYWATWNMARANPAYRGYGDGILSTEQIRGQGWGMRSLAEVSWMLPDTHALKSYFATRLSKNLEWFASKYQASNPGISPLGAMESPYSSELQTGPWQNDFVGIVFGLLAENKEPKASETLNWVSQFNIGRFLNESQGFCTALAPGYYWKIRDTNKNFLASWRAMAEINFPDIVCNSTLAITGYPDQATGYAATARAMMASAQAAGVSNAAQAYWMWAGKTPNMDKAMLSDPTWAIVPRP